jgi:deoxyadenosine/deoxycytidine kinase
MTKVVFISVDGNIGCGKTTLLNRLRLEMPNITVIDEPVGQWSILCNETGKSLLELFYEDQKRWGYTFQNCAILTRLKLFNEVLEEVKKKEGIQIIISERSILTDKYVFADMLKKSGHIDQLEWDLYCMWFDSFGRDYQVSAIIHLNTSPETSFQRIHKRNRKGEDLITFEYIQQLGKQHIEWISSTDLPVLNISTEEGQDPEQNIREIKLFLNNMVEMTLY